MKTQPQQSSIKKIERWRKTSVIEEKIDYQNRQALQPKSIIEDMQWFPFQGIMLHTENNINSPDDNLKSLLKVFSIFKLIIWYDKTIVQENVPYYVGILCTNFGKTIGCLLENQTI